MKGRLAGKEESIINEVWSLNGLLTKKNIMRNKAFIYIFLMLSVAFGGEFKFYPLAVDIRVSLGTPIFFFFLLWSQKIKPIKAGLLVGVSVVIFRTSLAVLWTPNVNWTEELQYHAPVFFYYFIFGLFFYLFRTRSFYNRPLIIALIGMVLENTASVAEIFFRHYFSSDWITLNVLITIFVTSFFRSFFVLGFFNFFLLRDANITEAIQRKRNEEMLVLVSDLFVEMVQLKKSMKNAENTTKACYELYRELMNNGNENAQTALHIAGEIHEIKKDHQRIYSGLSKLKVKKLSTDLMKIEEIINIAIECNRRYAKMLEKSIHFEVNILGEHPQYNCFIVLSLINNLITNSIEAIETTGNISVLVKRSEENVSLQIKDNGPGIPLNKLSLVFEPGYTTKYDDSGIASNGIGLSHIKEVIECLNGEIQLNSDQNRRNTIFVIQLPVKTINYIG